MSQMIQCVLTFLTFSESKQAITLPFSTWQLFGGWANLHSSSLREQFPRWNCRHTSRVSHFVSLTEEMFNAMSKGYNHIWDFLKFNIIVVPHTPKAVGLLYVQSSFYNNQVSFFSVTRSTDGVHKYQPSEGNWMHFSSTFSGQYSLSSYIITLF